MPREDFEFPTIKDDVNSVRIALGVIAITLMIVGMIHLVLIAKAITVLVEIKQVLQTLIN